jgi:hypothetical protein
MKVSHPDQVSALCVDCGICCSGILFEKATIGVEEVDFARSIGLHAWVDHVEGGDKGRFDLPCHHLCGTACGRYGEPRPSVCSGFFCELALRLDRDEIALEDAAGIVSQTREVHGKLAVMIGPDQSLKSLRASAGQFDSAPADRQQAQQMLLVAALNRLLDRYFLPPQENKSGGGESA